MTNVQQSLIEFEIAVVWWGKYTRPRDSRKKLGDLFFGSTTIWRQEISCVERLRQAAGTNSSADEEIISLYIDDLRSLAKWLRQREISAQRRAQLWRDTELKLFPSTALTRSSGRKKFIHFPEQWLLLPLPTDFSSLVAPGRKKCQALQSKLERVIEGGRLHEDV